MGLLWLLEAMGRAGLTLFTLWVVLLALKVIAVYLCTHGWLIN
jgi:hypothetical protein